MRVYCIYKSAKPAAYLIDGIVSTTVPASNSIQNIAIASEVEAYVKSIHSLTICSDREPWSIIAKDVEASSDIIKTNHPEYVEKRLAKLTSLADVMMRNARGSIAPMEAKTRVEQTNAV